MYGSAWNTGTCLFMIWVGLGCLMQCINSIVWNKNIINRAPVYCDICKSLDLSSREFTHSLLPDSNPHSSRPQCCGPGQFTLHQPPLLQDCYHESCSLHIFRETQ